LHAPGAAAGLCSTCIWASEVRRYGFVTEIKLEDGSQVRFARAIEPERSRE
jgi:hypothetical protein